MIGSGLLIVVVTGVLFLYLSPEFGGVPTTEQKKAYLKSPNYSNGKFINKGNVKLDMSMRDMGKTLAGFFGPSPLTKPNRDIPVMKLDSMDIVNYQESTRLIWFGHSAFLLQMHNKTVLIDPMFGQVPAPHPMLGSNRFSKELPIEVEQLPRIDAVLISHDHYDHLDYGSIQKLKGKVNMFYTPLGVGVHLQKWGIAKERIVEMDWWQEVVHDDLIFRCAPAQHFSGRGLTDRANTLWSSWVIQSERDNIFFSGDSGYGPHFKEIGDKYGPFDLAMIECGQYNEMWPDIHMFPEQTAQAGLDVGTKQIMPIHWGAFKLAMHPWTEPVERVSHKAKELNVGVLTPRIGEPINLNKLEVTTSQWWK
jgi:L-ascorbate metabolism protein UlaG (beta-lactamase superfamily)